MKKLILLFCLIGSFSYGQNSNAHTLNSQLGTYYLSRANHTGTQDAVTTLTGLNGIASYNLTLGGAGITLANGASYSYGQFFSVVPSTTVGANAIKVPKSGTVRSVDVSMICTAGATVGTGLTTVYLRYNGSDTSIGTSTMTGTSIIKLTSSALSVAITAGNLIEIKVVNTGTYTITPVGCALAANVIITN